MAMSVAQRTNSAVALALFAELLAIRNLCSSSLSVYPKSIWQLSGTSNTFKYGMPNPSPPRLPYDKEDWVLSLVLYSWRSAINVLCNF